MPKVSRRSFLKNLGKISVFACTAPLLSLLSRQRVKEFPDIKGRLKDGYVELYSGPQPLTPDTDSDPRQLLWKTHSSSIIIDDKMPPGYVDFVNLKKINFQKTMNKELTRSLYAS